MANEPQRKADNKKTTNGELWHPLYKDNRIIQVERIIFLC